MYLHSYFGGSRPRTITLSRGPGARLPIELKVVEMELRTLGDGDGAGPTEFLLLDADNSGGAACIWGRGLSALLLELDADADTNALACIANAK
jgi:hypothetical protein